MRVVWMLLLALFVAPTMLVAQSSKPKVTVVTVTDGPSPSFDLAQHDLTTEIESQLGDRYDVELAPTLQGDWTRQSVARQLDAAYSNPGVTAVFGFGHLVVAEVASRKRLPKPTILPFVTEAARQGLPRTDDVSGRRNLSYITESFDVSDEAERLHDVAGARNIVLLAESNEASVLPKLGDDLQVAVAEAQVQALLDAIPASADGVILTPMRRLTIDQRTRLASGLIQRRLPNVAINPDWVEQGAMMSIRSPNNELRRAQRGALNLELILEGRPSNEMHVNFEDRQELVINMATARAIGVRPTYEILLEAELVNEMPEQEDRGQIEMGTAMRDAIDANLDLLIAEKFVEAGEEQVKINRGPLLPQGVLTGSLIQRDPDRIIPGGQIAERQGTYTARASQSIYAEAAWTRFKSTRLRQEGREYGYFGTVLDIMLQAGVAYVGVLRAEAQERIQRKNIQLTREYLELARVRLEVGVANASELYRWQVTLAENQRSVVDARAVVAQTKIELNRVLNRPSEASIDPIDLPHDAEGRTEPPDDPIGNYMNDPFSFKLLRAFMVREGLRNSPEARQIEKRREAEERIRSGRTRELWLPEFFVEGGVQHDFWRDGVGTETPPLLDFLGVPPPDKFGWDVGLFLSIPLSRGGSKVAEMRQAGVLIERLTAQYARIEQDIDTGVRTELYSAAAARASVALATKAAKAAQNNLILVVDLYRRGKVGIITLTDAQTQALIADLAAADATYDYLLALLFVNREAGHFRNLDTPEAKADFAARLNEFVMAGEAVLPATLPAP